MMGEFKNSTKYAVERRFDGQRVRLVQENQEYSFSDGFSMDSLEIPRLVPEDFVVEAWGVGGELYVSDVLSFAGEDVSGDPWNQRYLLLKNEFDWSRPVYLSKHIVVQDEEAFQDALELFSLLPHSEGAVVKPYHSEYSDETYFVPTEEIQDV